MGRHRARGGLPGRQARRPPEDCGGPGGYELISAAIDPLNPDHSDAVIEFERMYGIEFHVDGNGLNPFRIDVIDAELAKRFPPGTRPERADPPGDLPGPLEELLSAVRDGYARRELRWLIGAALAGKPDIVTVTAARMVRPYAWVLDRVGDEGIRLTGAGYLPPAHVEAAATELGLLEDWIGKGNRESQTLPVLHLRETATKMGLLRKHRGMLLLTAATLSARHWAHDTGLSAYQGQPGPRASSGRTVRSARRTCSSGSRKWSATLAKVAFPPAR